MSILLTDGVNAVWEEDTPSQIKYLTDFHKVVRSMDRIDSLVEGKCFFVPNDHYLVDYFGAEIRDPSYGLYDWEGRCAWQNYVIFPVYDLLDKVTGFAGYDIYGRSLVIKGEDVDISNFYRFQPSNVFPKGRYLYSLPGVLKKAISDGCLAIVDGLYDCHSIHMEGINVACSLGSVVTEEVLFILSFIDNIFVLEDNDKSGRMLYESIAERHSNTFYVRQNKTKDSDDISKSLFRSRYIDELKLLMQKNRSKTMRF